MVIHFSPVEGPCRCSLFRRGWRPGELVRITQLQAGHVDDLLRATSEVRNAVEDQHRSGHGSPRCAERPEVAGHLRQPGLATPHRWLLPKSCKSNPNSKRTTHP